jgi:HTH-type transcriptional regulator/antitoxin HipB
MTQLARTPKQLGAILGRQRRLANLTQTELGRRAGLRQATISEIESGKATTRLGTICDVLAALDLELTVAPRSKSSSADIEEIFS